MEGMTNKAAMDSMMTKVHGKKMSSTMMAHQGASEFMGGKSNFNNPFSSEKQRKYLWARKPKVAKKLAHG